MDITNNNVPVLDTENQWFQARSQAFHIKDLTNFPNWYIPAWTCMWEYTVSWKKLVRKFQTWDAYAWIVWKQFVYDKFYDDQTIDMNLKDIDWTDEIPVVYPIWRYVTKTWWFFKASLSGYTTEFATAWWFTENPTWIVANAR